MKQFVGSSEDLPKWALHNCRRRSWPTGQEVVNNETKKLEVEMCCDTCDKKWIIVKDLPTEPKPRKWNRYET